MDAFTIERGMHFKRDIFQPSSFDPETDNRSMAGVHKECMARKRPEYSFARYAYTPKRIHTNIEARARARARTRGGDSAC